MITVVEWRRGICPWFPHYQGGAGIRTPDLWRGFWAAGLSFPMFVPSTTLLTKFDPDFPIIKAEQGFEQPICDSYSSFPNTPPWQSPLDPSGLWPSTQDSTISQRIQRIIFTSLHQPISITYSYQLTAPKVTEQARVFQDPVRIFNPG